MTILLWAGLIRILFCLIVPLLGALISKKSFIRRAELRPFECGFRPASRGRRPFSIQFFILSLVFLIFDVELVILIPYL